MCPCVLLLPDLWRLKINPHCHRVLSTIVTETDLSLNLEFPNSTGQRVTGIFFHIPQSWDNKLALLHPDLCLWGAREQVMRSHSCSASTSRTRTLSPTPSLEILNGNLNISHPLVLFLQWIFISVCVFDALTQTLVNLAYLESMASPTAFLFFLGNHASLFPCCPSSAWPFLASSQMSLSVHGVLSSLSCSAEAACRLCWRRSTTRSSNRKLGNLPSTSCLSALLARSSLNPGSHLSVYYFFRKVPYWWSRWEFSVASA